MFSQVPVSTRGGYSPNGWVCPGGTNPQGMGTQRQGWVCPGATRSLRVGISGDGYSPPLIHETLDTMGYGPQADGMYPNGMLSSCLLIPAIKHSFCSILFNDKNAFQ